ncbi:MAG TPA: NAD(P)H-hydrate epimerase, partial [Candidatus Binatia bacterium]|nr:NAD(P)H-hydrate epimerase [Candidatus Binatia bacterium]
MLVVTTAQMREMDRLTIQKYGVSGLTLMERAGERIAQTILERLGPTVKKGVLVVAGKGNNGGDGLVVARLLKKKRIPSEVALLAKKNELSPDAGRNLAAYLKLRGKVTEITEASVGLLSERVRGKGLLVDAILGTGIRNAVKGLYAEAITLMNDSAVPLVAADIPSGLDSDSGMPLGVAVQAEMTVALA